MTQSEADALLAKEEEHPFLILPSTGQVLGLAARGKAGIDTLTSLLAHRRERMDFEKADRLRYGFDLESWKLAERAIADREICNELLVLGGNRSGKTQWAAKKVVQVLFSRPEREAWCFQTTEQNSQLLQQPRVHDYLPPEWRAAKRGSITNISFKRATGFSNNRFVAPNGSLCQFRNYAQEIDTIEGGEIDIAWADELIPLSWIETLRYRLITRNGLLIVTFTPIEGWSPTVREYLDGARTLESCEAELLKHEHDPERRIVPLLQESRNRKKSRIVYFHTQANGYNPWDRMRADLEGRPRAEILARAYGVPTKAIAGKFPRFGERNVINDDQWKSIRRGAWYHTVDPCNGRNFAMHWALITPDGKKIIAREWPQEGDYIPGIGNPGAWAVPHGTKNDGERGEAQRPFGFGLQRYREEIARIEAELSAEWGGRVQEKDGSWRPIRIIERYMDSRFGNAPTLSKGEATTLIEEFEGLDDPLYFTPAAGLNIDEGVTLINSELDFDPGLPISALNTPKLFIHERCYNHRFALTTWTGADGKHGACKDFIDILRYLLLADPEYIDPTQPIGHHGPLTKPRNK